MVTTTVLPHESRAVVRLSFRLVRRSVLAVVIGIAALLILEGVAFEIGYPDVAARQALLVWAEDPGLRMIAGPGFGVDTVGGFVVWDAGLYVVLGLGAWALTLTSRLMRGDEAAGRMDLLLARPVTAVQVLLVQWAVLVLACLGVGASVALALRIVGAQLAGSLLYGTVTAGFCLSLMGLSAVTAQLFVHRRTALGVAGAVFGLLIILRIAGNSADDRTWLAWLSPAGWLDRSEAFGAQQWWVVGIPVAVGLCAVVVSVWLRRARDTGSGVFVERQRHRSTRLGLGSAAAFAWRAHQGNALAWIAGVAVAGAAMGLLLPMIDLLLAQDDSYQQLLAYAGIDVDDLTRSFVGMIGMITGLAIGVYSAFRIGAVRREEESGCADLILVRPVPRWQWLAGHLTSLVVAVVLLSLTLAMSLWLAAQSGGATLALGDAVVSSVAILPALAVIIGLTVLAFGLMPRLAVAVGIGALIVSYLLELVGPVLNWPEWVLALSPFHHLAAVPVEPFDWLSAVVMVGIGALFAGAGVAALARRDITGA
jgi:ABC-2 type transport system permease protein